MEAEDDCDDEIAVVACADATMTTTTNNNSNNSNNSDSNSNSVATTLVPWGFYPHAARRPEEGDGPDDALDETDVRWRRKSKHFFILSSSGKPVWSRHGDENALAGFMAVIQALVSFVQGAGDTLRSIELGGGALAVIKVAGPLYLATVSRRRGEGVRMLSRQLDLLHLQVMSILTKAVERALVRSSRFDMRQLLGGTSHIFHSLCRAMHWELGIGLRAIQAERCDAGLRREITDRLSSVLGRVQAAGRDAAGENGAQQQQATPLMGAIFSNHRLLALTMTSEIDKQSLPTPWDLLLLANFVLSSPSFHENEGFSPVCLPEYDDRRFVYCYVSFIRPQVCLVLVDEMASSFHYLSEAREVFEAELGVASLDAMERIARENAGDYVVTSTSDDAAVADGGGDVRTFAGAAVSAEGQQVQHANKGWGDMNSPAPTLTGLWHCCYNHHEHSQYTMPCLPRQFMAKEKRRLLMRAYNMLQNATTVGVMTSATAGLNRGPDDAVDALTPPQQQPSPPSSRGAQAGAGKPHRVVFIRDDSFTLVACVSSDLLGMCVFDPCTERTEAVARYHQVSAWIRNNDDLFAPVGSF